MDHVNDFEDTWKTQVHEWVDNIKEDVLNTGFNYVRLSIGREKKTALAKKKCLTLPSLSWNFLNCLKDESDEPIYTCKDKDMRRFVRQSMERGRWTPFNQLFKSELSEKVFETILEELILKKHL